MKKEKNSVITARVVAIICILFALGWIDPLFEGQFRLSFSIIIVCAIIFLLVRKKAAFLQKDSEEKDPRII